MSKAKRGIVLLAAAAMSGAVAACGSSGHSGSSSPTPTSTPGNDSFTLAIDGTAFAMDFAQTHTVAFHLTPANGFTGTVTVTLAANSAGLATSTSGATVSITGAGEVAGSIDVDTGDVANVIPGRYATLALHASSGTAVADAVLPAVTIRPDYLVHIPAGIGTGAATDAWGPDITTGLVLHMGRDETGAPNQVFHIGWKNDDAVNHTIHTQGYDAFGFTHGVQPTDPNGDPGGTQTRDINPMLSAGSTESRTFLPSNFYCHTHGKNSHAGKLTFVL